MNDKRPTLQECAMRYGTIMGLFWAFKFVLFPIGLTIPIFQIVFALLTLFVPILGYLFTRRYRILYCDGVMGFRQAFTFCLFMFMFASLLIAVVHYIYFQYLDNGYIYNEYLNLISQLKSATDVKENLQSLNQLEESLKIFSSLTPIEITFQLITFNLFSGLLMALPIAALTMRKK